MVIRLGAVHFAANTDWCILYKVAVAQGKVEFFEKNLENVLEFL